jgi:N-acetylglucosaminyl-diphospho-decaprenol L-rhamnosyltransferase
MNLASGKEDHTLDLSVIVVSYNTRRLLAHCVASVLESCARSPITSEVFVIDNSSTDGSPAEIRERFPSVQVVDLPHNMGYAAAANEGIRRSSGRVCCILNADVEVLDNSLESMFRFLNEHPDAGIVGANLQNRDGTEQESCFRFPTLAMTFLDFFPLNHRLARSRVNGRYPAWQQAGPFLVDHPLGACLTAKKELIKDIGLLDERYFMYCEEIDWCYRAKEDGWQVYCLPEAKLVHLGGQSTSQRRGEMYYALHRARYMFFRRYYSHRFVLIAAAITRIGVINEYGKLWLARRSGKVTDKEYGDLRHAYRRILSMRPGAV